MQSCRVALPLEAVFPNRGPLCVLRILLAAGAPTLAGRRVLARGPEWLVRGMRGAGQEAGAVSQRPSRSSFTKRWSGPRLVLADVVVAADEVLAVGVDGILPAFADRPRLLPVLELTLLDPRPQPACALDVHGRAYPPPSGSARCSRRPPAKRTLAR